MVTQAQRRDRQDVSGRVLAYGVLIGPLAWFAHLALSYLLETTRCVSGLSGAELWMHAVSIVGIVLVAAGGGLSWQAWQRLRPASGAQDDTVTGRQAFVALAGVLLCGLFGLTIVVGALPALFLESCA
jgi:hypothetical protein